MSGAGRGIAVGLMRGVARARIANQVIRRLRRAGVRDARYDAATFTVRFLPKRAGDRESPQDAENPHAVEASRDQTNVPHQRHERVPEDQVKQARQADQTGRAEQPRDPVKQAQAGPAEQAEPVVPTVLELAGLLADRSGSRRERRRRVDRFVAGFLRTPGLPDDWDHACPLLRPVLRGGTPLAADITAPLRRPALPYLAEFVVVDQPETMTYVSADQLSAWDVSAGEVFAAARNNLSGAVLRGVAHEHTVVHFVDDGDAYWTSHLLLDGWLGRLAEQVGGVPVAFAPERGTLLVAADGSEQLPGLFAQAEAVYASSPRAITPMAYVSDARGHTVPYSAPEGHPLRRCVQRAEGLLAATEYARHAGALPGNVAELRVVGSEADGWRTRAVWDRDEPALLPSADEVLVGDRLMPWRQIAADLIPVPDLNPPRWQATGWPPGSADQQKTPPT
jgi:hypothetical protein